MTEEEFADLDFSEFYFRGERWLQDQRDRNRDGMIQAAFTAWLMSIPNGERRKFDRYLHDIGLGDEKPRLSAEEREAVRRLNEERAAYANQRADEITHAAAQFREVRIDGY